jgi:DNA invertase Pin-like site-specific DNA recombinase
MDEQEQVRERVREGIEDAVARALEAGFSAEEVRAEVQYAIESYEPG